MNRTYIIQSIINATKSQRYLEIGVQAGINFNKIKCRNKTGVDPVLPSFMTAHEKTSITKNEYGGLTSLFQCTSDEFFYQYPQFSHANSFDVAFIDGLHLAEQVSKDIINCANHACTNKAFIIVHDCNPTKEELQRREPVVAEWCGDVWKGWIWCKRVNGFTVDCDYGVGIIDISKTDDIFDIDFNYTDINMTYEQFDLKREELLNLKSVDFFKEWVSKL